MSSNPQPDPTDPLRAALERALGGQYRIVRLLGRGGMGAVYLARDVALERLVAIKVLPRAAETDPESRERFRREARTAARLAHPNIVPLHGFGDVAGTLYLVMGFVNGESLAAHLKRRGRLPFDEARRLLADVAEALDYAHRRGIVHRDLKPDNILLDDETGRAMLADFGIAKAIDEGEAVTRVGSIVGTPLYMSPEQARGESLDGRSDLYSLGAVAHAMLAGAPPFETGTPRDAFLKRLTSDPPPLRTRVPEAPADLAEAVDRCLARERDRRFRDARELAQAIAPTALDDDELPEPLDSLDGQVVNLAVLVLALAFALLQFAGHVAERDFRLARGEPALRSGLFQVAASLTLLGVVAMKLPMLTAAAGAARRRGFSRSQVVRAFLRQPRRWPCFYYPRRFRRRDDVWERLPRPFRTWRWVATLATVDAVLVVGLASVFQVLVFEPAFLAAAGLRGDAATVAGLLVAGLVGACVAGLAALAPVAIVSLLGGSRLLRGHGLETFELRRVARAFLVGPTADRGLWQRPDLSRFLLPAPDGGRLPSTVGDYPGALAERAARAPEPLRPLAGRCVTAGSALARAHAEADATVQRLEPLVDPSELERLDERLRRLATPLAGERAELHGLLSQQRAWLAGRLERLAAARSRREGARVQLDELWRAVSGLAAADRGGRCAAALAAAEAFLGPTTSRDDEETREQPGAEPGRGA